MTKEEVIKHFVDHAKTYDPTVPNKNWYVGITNDPNRRKEEHECQKDITCAHFTYIQFRTEEDARLVEKWLEDAGFAITEKALRVKPDAVTHKSTGFVFAEGIKKDNPSNYVYMYQAIK